MQASTFTATPKPTTRDFAGRTLAKAREEAGRETAPAGFALVIGRYYARGSLSPHWVWALRAQVPAKAPHAEELEGGARFRGVEVVSPTTGPVKVRIPW
jgi:hypothetical protein